MKDTKQLPARTDIQRDAIKRYQARGWRLVTVSSGIAYLEREKQTRFI